MRTVAFVGGGSQIAKDLILAWAAEGRTGMQLYVRDLEAAEAWLKAKGLRGSCTASLHSDYGREDHDAVINFVGPGFPQHTADAGASVFDLTLQFDDMVLRGLRQRPDRRYIFLSSGAVYGSAGFQEPAGAGTMACVPVNAVTPKDYYGVAKLHAEARHRAQARLAITDLRVFNYFTRTQDLASRTFITDMLRAARDGAVFQASPDYIVRDYLHPQDFRRLVDCVLAAPPRNEALDCYTRQPVDKPTLLEAMRKEFGLQHVLTAAADVPVNATGLKPYYYSLNRKAAEIGYEPAYTALEGLLIESRAALGRGA